LCKAKTPPKTLIFVDNPGFEAITKLHKVGSKISALTNTSSLPRHRFTGSIVIVVLVL